MSKQEPQVSPQVLFRYQQLRPDVDDLLRNGHLWFSNPSAFNDPFDSLPRFDAGAVELLKGEKDERLRTHPRRRDLLTGFARCIQHDHFLEFANTFRIACFSEVRDCILMWSHYAAFHTGVCIGFRPERIPVTPDKGIRWKVTYSEDRLPITIDSKQAYKIVFTKAKAWEYEKEWRILMHKDDLKKGKRPYDRCQKPGHFLQVPDNAFESVHFGAKVDRRLLKKTLTLLKQGQFHHVKVFKMQLSIDRFQLEEERLV